MKNYLLKKTIRDELAERRISYREWQAEHASERAEARAATHPDRKASRAIREKRPAESAQKLKSASAAKRDRSGPGQPVWLPGNVEVRVAGESFHVDAIRAAEQSRSPGSQLTAVLVPDPGNAHDSHAVEVHVNGEHVGFLLREVAARAQAAIVAFSLAHGGRRVSCPAEIRWRDVGPQVVLLLDPRPLGLRAEMLTAVPDMAVTIMRLLSRLDKPAPRLADVDAQARLALARAEAERQAVDAGFDRSRRDLRRVEDALRSLASRLAAGHDRSASDAWLSLARTVRYQSGRRDDTLTALIEALYWDRGNDQAWSELVDYASAAPHVPMLLALFAHVPPPSMPALVSQLLRISEGRDRLGRLNPAAGPQLRDGLLAIAEAQDSQATIAALTQYAGNAAAKSGDLDAATGYWRRAIAAGSTDAKMADKLSVWLASRHEYQEAARVLRQALKANPDSATVADRMRRRLARCEAGETPEEASSPGKRPE